jgi:hypothetical protein
VACTLKRLAISAFVVAHLSMVTLWIVPPCALKSLCLNSMVYYMMPLGQWQYWGMFSPDPVKDTVMLEAVVLDAKGLLHTYSFPTEQDWSVWGASLHYRHSKYAANCSLKEEFKAQREFAARYVTRQLKLPEDAFPVEVQIMYKVKPSPPPGGPLPDPMTPLTHLPIETYRFPTLQETRP